MTRQQSKDNPDDDGTAPAPAEYITGGHLLDLIKGPHASLTRELFGEDLAVIVLGWHRMTIEHNRPRFFGYPAGGRATEADPLVDDLLAVPVTPLIEEFLVDHGAAVPTRREVRDWAEADRAGGGDGIDPEIEYERAMLAADPDLSCDDAERRIGGVPESVYVGLNNPGEQDKVLACTVIPPPQAPTAVAHRLVRTRYTRRLLLPGKNPRRRKAWMRTLLRVDQVWYEYARPAAGGPPRWRARTNPEWMRAQLREALRGMWYVKTKDLKGGPEYSLKSWTTDDRSLGQLENALADLLSVGPFTGTHAREIPDLYGDMRNAYPAGTWVLARNGVLDVHTGRTLANTPLWFSLSQIAADYDRAADPDAECEWLRMLRTQWPDDPGAIICLQQWFGYVLSGRTDLQKWMLIIGPSGSGKSIIAEVLGALMGVVSATKLDSLNSQFGLQALYETGAQLAVMSDIRFGARDSSTAVGNLLGVVGEDEVIVERKYKTAVSAKLGVRFHGSANEMPRWSDNSSALQRRALILETTRSFRGTDDEDPGLKKRIIDNELGLVLRWAVEGLALLDAANGTFTRSRHAAELDNDLAELSSPVRTFIAECCEIGTAEDFVELASLYRVWGKWAEQNNTGRGMSQNKFRAAIKALYLGAVKPGQKFEGPRVVWGIKRAEVTYRDRDRFGVEMSRILATDSGPTGDPMRDYDGDVA
jgi:P4 family phage/plasmid primase-like protien